MALSRMEKEKQHIRRFSPTSVFMGKKLASKNKLEIPYLRWAFLYTGSNANYY